MESVRLILSQSPMLSNTTTQAQGNRQNQHQRNTSLDQQETVQAQGRGFAGMDPQRQREIASMGGRVSGGNFANNPNRAAEAGRRGGQTRGQREKEERKA
jgi:general stress protein YciG